MSIQLCGVIGVDEAGRGPLAGPVVAAAVILPYSLPGLTDSKKISEKKRIILSQMIQEQAIDFAYGEASCQEIDTLNIHHATLVAMERAILGLQESAHQVIIDGCFAPKNLNFSVQTMVQGDLHHPSISAASILAKVRRDNMMLDLDKKYPHYGFKQHKGYGTRAHLQAIQEFGPCPEHRQSFGPIKALR